jgi:hypothetical protein
VSLTRGLGLASPPTAESEDRLLAMGVLTHVSSFLEDLQPHVRVASCFFINNQFLFRFLIITLFILNTNYENI